MAGEFKLPSIRDRVAIMGRTGSGKTQFGTWLLSQSPFDLQPYVVVDYKGDDLLNAIGRIREIGLDEHLPKHPGLYIIHPVPVDDDDAMEAWLRKAWKRESIGLYFDEAYMLPNKGALQGILTQGRSKHIPAIVLTQRPARIPRFVFSEADHYVVFHLNDDRDRAITREFMPEGWPEDHAARPDHWISGKPPKFHSWWYSVAEDDDGKSGLFPMAPVPDADTIAETIEDRLAPKRVMIK